MKLLARSLAALVPALLALAFLPATYAMAQTQTGCFPPSQSLTGVVTVTEWCQILDNSPASPIAASSDSGFFTLDRGFGANYLHVEYSPWYWPMDSVIYLEFISSTKDIVFSPIVITTSSVSYSQDIYLGVFGMNAGDRMRIRWDANVPHTCNPMDNCGMYMTLSFVTY